MKETRDCFTSLPKWVAPHERRERLKRRDAREHRQRILDAAQKLFSELGVDAVSMHQIAIEAGLGQGTLYRCYAHKGDLCMDLLYERYEQFIAELGAFFSASVTEPALQRLKGLLERMVTFLENESDLLSPISQASPRGSQHHQSDCGRADASQFLNTPFDWLYQLFSGLLNEAVERGELARLDVGYTADALLATLCPMVYRFQRQERGFSKERILQGLYHLYIDGLKTPQEETEQLNR